MAKVSIGERIYYTGDRANLSWWGMVLEVNDNDVVLAHDNGCIAHVFPSAIGEVYQGHCDPRFVTERAFRAYHEAVTIRP